MAKKKKAKRKPASAKLDLSFEESLAQLEEIVAELESGELGLGEALARYEQGIGRLKHCHAQLSAASRKIELLSGVDDAGNPITESYDDEDSASLEEKRAARSKRRGARGAAQAEDVDDDGRLF